ncbi:Uma2 family endonuclease [Nonomuraea phyllanthi]|uniref:Uma2 family endonuclease n=1 Tax=Nonomuraea phyllanthi TaxID=2219224 RepID=A0A5C4V4Y0_9ACTN|nr:Uma2 family endonuclease [Nonomuraea phyllanthi]KAB8186233.1 Uma2 family endonuclease [Nonomuraea phyllanthi]QFY11561.1 Uma2 family endonuclease [Nonomuraea phyllanthi]
MVDEKHQTESTCARPPRTPHTVRELFDALPPLPGHRVEVIEGKLIVSPSGIPEHFMAGEELAGALRPLRKERGWHGAPGPHICIDGPRDSIQPDYVMWPPGCKRWGDELLSPGVLMAAEVVSPSSVRIDRVDKLRLYALGGVPVYLLIDPVSESPSATVYSDIKDGEYRAITSVPMGKPLHLPDPIDFELDTSIFMV